MSLSDLNKTINLHNESTHSLPIPQKHSYYAIDMESVKKETVTPGPLTIATSRDIVCIDVKENSIEHRTDTNEEVDAGILANISQLKVHVIVPVVARRNHTINNLYYNMVYFGKQRLARLTWRQEQPFSPSEQTDMTHDDRTQSRLTSLKPQVSPPDPKLFQAQGGFGQGQGNPPPAQGPGQGYPQPPSYPQNPRNAQRPGNFQIVGYVESQGNPPPGEDQALHYNPKDRNSFVVLVLAVTCIMIATTAILIGVVVLNPDLKKIFKDLGYLVMIPSIILQVLINYAFACIPIARKAPLNIILLIFTIIAMSGLVSSFSSRRNTDILLYATVATAVVVGLCTLLALTSFDFTSYMLYFVMLGLALSITCGLYFGVKVITGRTMLTYQVILLILSTLLQAAILVAELQVILGDKAIELHEDEWAFGAYLLFTSIVNLFIGMMGLLDSFSED